MKESNTKENDMETYNEEDPTVCQWLKDAVPSVTDVKTYTLSLFPCINWIPRYNLQWLIGDVVAG
jgi:sodium-independent sulfate anion transporter 11